MSTINEKIQISIETWKKNLLDISQRNQSINFRRRATSTIQVIYPPISNFFDSVTTARGVPFAEIFDDEEVDEEDPTLIDSADEPEYITIYGRRIPKKDIYNPTELTEIIDTFVTRKRSNFLFSNYNNNTQRKVLRNLMKKARTFKEENAINVLYFAVGFLEWFEGKNSSVSHKAPLLFLSAELNQETFDAPFRVACAEGDLLTNDSLIQKLMQDFNLNLSYDLNKNDLSAFDTFQEYKSFVLGKITDKRWKVHDEIDLGIFSFSKINMVKDLDENADKIAQNTLIQQISGISDNNVGDTLFEESEIDRIIQPTEYFHTLSADSSQEIAIQSAIAGKSFVLQGPPGTGKSQTITNIITELIARNKKVLFVAEKKAALDVVYNNLRKIGLNDYALPIHNSKLDKKEVLQELNKTLEKGQKQVGVDESFLVHESAKFSDSRKALIEYWNKLLEIRKPIGKNLYQLYGTLLSYQKFPYVKFTLENVEQIDPEKLQEIQTKIVSFSQALKENDYLPHKNPWYGLNHLTLTIREREALLDELSTFQTSLINLQRMLEDLAIFIFKNTSFYQNTLSLTKLLSHFLKCQNVDSRIIDDANIENDIRDYETLSYLIDQINKIEASVTSNYDLNVLKLDTQRGALVARQKSNIIKRLFSKEYRTFKKDFLLYRQNPRLKYSALLSDLSIINRLKDLEKTFESVSSRVTYKIDQKSFESFQEALNNLKWFVGYKKILDEEKISLKENTKEIFIKYFGNRTKNDELISLFLKAFNTFDSQCKLVQSHFNDSFFKFNDLTFKIMAHKVETLIENAEKLPLFVNLNFEQNKLIQIGLGDFCSKVIEHNIQKSFVEVFSRRFYELLVDKYVNDYLPGFNGGNFDVIRKSFSEAQNTISEIAKTTVESNILAQIPNYNGTEGYNIEVVTLRTEANKSRKILPFRVLFGKVPNLITRLKPCLMMSPLSVSTFLRGSNLTFDTVIFDEASQVKPENAIGAIFRAKQFIISGDKEQLPPTNFFQNIDDDEEAVSENYTSNAFDSILEISDGFLSSVKLRWHYRSKFEELIHPSNKEIYQNLITFPSPIKPGENEAIKYIHVNGVYADRRNEAEAEKAVDILTKVIKKYGTSKSVGIVTFNSEQQMLIERKINHLRRTQGDFEGFFANNETEPFFIKNIETVQGDERDIIIISVVYGPDGQGKVSMNFGPLNQVNGYRRLNVAVTRAKTGLFLITSMKSTDIDLNRSQARGAKFLKHYLEYAEYGEDEKVDGQDESSQCESPFEQDVYDELTRMGHTVKKQVGCSGYRIDMAILDPKNPAQYILGIECDGATYHSSRSARDRDCLRQQVLENRKWVIYRIWSTDWIKNKAQQVQRLKRFIENIPANTNSPEKNGKVIVPTVVNEKEVTDIGFDIYPNYENLIRSIKYRNADYSGSTSIIEVIKATSPISMDELKKIVPAFWGRQKFTSVVEEGLMPILRSLERNHWISRRNGFFIFQTNAIIFRKTTGASSRRNFENIHLDELKDGILKILDVAQKMKCDDLCSMIVSYCGFSSVSSNIRNIVFSCFDELKKDGKVLMDADTIEIK